MKRTIRCAVAWIITLALLSGHFTALAAEPDHAGDAPDTVSAAETETAAETESKDRPAPGYMQTDGEEEVPAAPHSLHFEKAMQELYGEDAQAELREDSLRPDSASPLSSFPVSHSDDWLGFFAEHYPPTRDQGAYGTCWAQVAATLAEFYLVSHSLADKSIDLSELHLAYWTYTQGTTSAAVPYTGDAVHFEKGEKNLLDNGGSLKFASETLMRQRGFVPEQTVSYGNASEVADGWALPADTERRDCAWLKNAMLISIRQNPELVKDAIVSNGAAGISFYADRNYYAPEHNAYYCPEGHEAEHTLTVVGWDDYFPAEYFAVSDNELPYEDGAWLVRNSWNASVSADLTSYFWLSYEDASLSGAWVYEVDGEFPYDNHYYYDSQIHANAYYGEATGVTEFANVFTVAGEEGAPSESLEAVSFEMALVNGLGTHYTVKVYGNLQGDTPDSGTLIRSATTEGVLYFEGVYTVPLKKNVMLGRGEKFAVVISFDEPGTSVVLEGAVGAFGQASSTVGVRSGQSFVSTDRKNWSDVLGDDPDMGNLVISALTKNGGEKPAVGRISVSPNSVYITGADETVRAEVCLYDVNGEAVHDSDYSYVVWESDAPQIADVTPEGVISGSMNGCACIRARYVDPSVSEDISACCRVTVRVPSEGQTAIPVPDHADGASFFRDEETISLNCITPGARIFYTLDGSTPSEESTEYAGPFVIGPEYAGKTVSLKAFAVAEGLSESEVLSVSYDVMSKGRMRLSSSANGTVIRSTVNDSLSLSAKLFWQSNEEEPADGFCWTVEDPAILRISAGEDGRQPKALLTGLKNGETTVCVSACNAQGEILSASILIRVDIPYVNAPYARPASGEALFEGDAITLSCNVPGASILYTIGGGSPVTEGKLYAAPIAITEEMAGSDLTLRFFSRKAGMLDSAEQKCTYRIKKGQRIDLSPMDPTVPFDPEEHRTLYLVKGQSFTPDTSVFWVSSNKKVLRIDKNGKVTAVAPGVARLGPASELDAEGNLRNGVDILVTIPKAEKKSITAQPGDSFRLKIDCIVPCRNVETGRTEKVDFSDFYTNVLWCGSNDEVATIDRDGLVRVIGPGRAVMSAFLNGKVINVKINVQCRSSVTCKAEADGTEQLITLLPLQKAVIKARDFRASAIRWECESGGALRTVYAWNGSKVLYYENTVLRITPDGRIISTGPGSCLIRGTDRSGATLRLRVVVNELPERQISLKPGETRKLSVPNLTMKEVGLDWELSGEVAWYGAGKVSAYLDQNGEAQLHSTYDPFGSGNPFHYSFRIIVEDPCLKTDAQLVQKGSNYVLTLPADCEEYRLDWLVRPSCGVLFQSSKPGMAFADEDGILHIKGKTKAVISANLYGKKITIKLVTN
ncbi:MAG: chitobiase/beta-hexosaminidase C-terminal domain-containing protein [Lachnospiraceae bacterium]|nr:chitobiase/beta-hexosaminidase C-terminal domain-containing protein [Lachnospiraceae bacterium]